MMTGHAAGPHFPQGLAAKRKGPLAVAVAGCALLLTLIVARSVWESYYPPYAREALKQRKEYYEKVLRNANLSWEEGLYYRVLNEPQEKR